MWQRVSVLLLVGVVSGFACAGGDEAGRSAPPNTPMVADELLDDALALPVTQDPGVFDRMAATDDPAYIPVIVEFLRFSWKFDDATNDAAVRALSRFAGTGEPTAEHALWEWWAEWIGEHDEVTPPAGFASYKGNLLSIMVNPNVGGFLRNGVTSRIRIEEIAWGGVERDGIPPLDDPPHIAAAEASYLEGGDRVFGVSINGEHRAYPLRILNAHEMANDELGGRPFSLTYCTLCGTGIVYAGEVDGARLTFGTSGLLYRSNKLMYDRNTETLWEQFGGVPVVGPLAERDIELKILPSVLTTWDDWRTQHPDTTVLDDDTGVYRASAYRPEGDPESIYYAVRESPDPLFPVWLRSGLLEDKEPVFGIVRDGAARAWPLVAVTEEAVINDMLAGESVVIVSAGSGTGARAYERGPYVFRPDSGSVASLVDETGARWLAEEDALVAVEGGMRLARVAGRTSYWFGWFSFFPRTTVYAVDAAGP